MAIARKKEDLNKKEIKELLKMLAEKEKQLMNTNMSLAQGKTKNLHSRRNIRKQIARIKTAARSINLKE
jgi:ribosomal protein L29